MRGSVDKLQCSAPKMFRRRRGDVFLLICFVAVVLYGIHVFRERYTVQQAAALQIHEQIKTQLLKNPYRRLANECSPMSQSCFTIIDLIRTEKKRLVADRLMSIDDLQGYVHSISRLKIPELLTMENSNVTAWPLDKKHVADGYFQMMIISGFATGALQHPLRRKQKVLMIGLGGGTIANFFTASSEFGINIETTSVEIDPFMVDLARQYFGAVNQRGTSNIVNTDGELFLRTAVEKKMKYNVLLLDACYSSDELQNGLLCPVDKFFEADVVKDMYDVLEDGGTVAVNTVFDKEVGGHEKRALDAFRQHFPSCDMVSYGAIPKMLVCTKKQAWSFQEQGMKFTMNIRRVNKIFGFDLHRYF